MSVADSFRDVLKKIAPDSEIAKKFSCGRTKTTCIMKVLAEEEVACTASLMKEFAFR